MHSISDRTDDTPEASTLTVKTWIGFGTMCLGMFMAILDIQIVATALPTIQSAIGIDPDQMSWVQTAYLIAEVIAIPLTGFLTRLLSMRWLFVGAISLFTVASAGCAFSHGFQELIVWRVVQGFSGGTLIPAVFSAVFLLFPKKRQGIATTLAGVLAVLAPTVGPIVGGWITDTYSWHWLFLINVGPGIVSALFGSLLLPREAQRFDIIKTLDIVSLLSLAVALTALELALKDAPQLGWVSAKVLGLLGLSLSAVVLFIRRTLGSQVPIVDLTSFADRNFAIGCALSFALGIGLFGSVYLMPVFLAFVREHSAWEIGLIMLATGVAQLLTAPIAVMLEQRMDARILSGAGFAMFALGLYLSTGQTPKTDFSEMLWPQIIRGSAIMFCLLPPTRLALGQIEPSRVPDASGLFNLMRNLGGAIGLALIDTVIFGRAPEHSTSLAKALQAGDSAMAAFVGIPPEMAQGAQPPTAEMIALAQPLVEKAALTLAINDAWLVAAILTVAALVLVPFARPVAKAG